MEGFPPHADGATALIVEGFPLLRMIWSAYSGRISPSDINGEKLGAVVHPAVVALHLGRVAVSRFSHALNAPLWRLTHVLLLPGPHAS